MRNLVEASTARCPRCRMTNRWCICAARREVPCPLGIDVLMHSREQYRPTSTGHLIPRVFPEAAVHPWPREQPPGPEGIRRPGRECWILHPHGQSPPAGANPAGVQVLLLDGVWSEATRMAQVVAGWGRLVALPMTGASRFWLRSQQDGGRFSTVEALLFLLDWFGLAAAHDELRRQFELHVYACLRVRGRTDLAAEFLRGSPIREAFPDLLAQLHAPRPLVVAPGTRHRRAAGRDGNDAAPV